MTLTNMAWANRPSKFKLEKETGANNPMTTENSSRNCAKNLEKSHPNFTKKLKSQMCLQKLSLAGTKLTITSKTRLSTSV